MVDENRNNFSDEELAISLARDAECPVPVAKPRRRRARKPAWQEPETLDEAEGKGFRVRNPLLDKDDFVVPDVLLKVHVRAGNHQVVGPIPSLVVDGEAMILKIPPAASRHFVPCDCELDQPESSKNLVKAVHVIGREGVLVLAKLLGDLMHLGRLIHRTTYKEYPFSHPAPPAVTRELRRLSHARAPGGHSPGAHDTTLASRNPRIRLPPLRTQSQRRKVGNPL